MKKVVFFLILLLTIRILYSCNMINKNEVSGNEFFYKFDKDQFTLDVLCELNYFEGFFSGMGTLQITRIKDTKIDGFYEIKLTNLSGNCNEHGECISSECIYSGEFPIGYFYVSENRIYMMSHDEDYLPLLCEMTTFPSTELIEQWNSQLKREGAHRGYFGYRLCCDNEGMEDTFGKEWNDEESVLYGEVAGDYHNYIEVKEDKRLFNFYPDRIMGTQEYMQIIWKKNHGIISFAKWAGNYKNYISFHVYDSGEYISIAY